MALTAPVMTDERFAAVVDQLGLVDPVRRAERGLALRFGRLAVDAELGAAGGDERTIILSLPRPTRDPVGAVQRLCSVAALIGQMVEARSLEWLPIGHRSDFAPFGAAVVALERQGVPPVLHLLAFDAGAGEGRRQVTTRGLGWFDLPELCLDGPASMSAGQLVRRAARLAIDQLVARSAVGAGRYPGIEPGERIIVGPPPMAGSDRPISVRIEPTPDG